MPDTIQTDAMLFEFELAVIGIAAPIYILHPKNASCKKTADALQFRAHYFWREQQKPPRNRLYNFHAQSHRRILASHANWQKSESERHMVRLAGIYC